MTTHTPGPWSNVAKEHLDDPSCPEFLIRCGTGYVATVDSSRDENTDNARLIAAAPDLLAALEALRNEVAGKPRPQILITLLGDADRAIARAKGE